MRIRWTGPSVTRRIVQEHVWDAANGFVCEVADHTLAQALIANGGGEFVEEEPVPGRRDGTAGDRKRGGVSRDSRGPEQRVSEPLCDEDGVREPSDVEGVPQEQSQEEKEA